jgi:excisionase family DNA binding protein
VSAEPETRGGVGGSGHTYTCPEPSCGQVSHPQPSAAEAAQLLQTHLALRHGDLNRREPLPGTRRAGGPWSRHVCHAAGCATRVPPRLLMCRPHWAVVPPALQAAVRAAYRPGQERLDPRPSPAYIRAHKRAVNAVAAAEGRPLPHPGAEDDARPRPPAPVPAVSGRTPQQEEHVMTAPAPLRPRLGSAADPDAATHPLMTVPEAARALRVSEMTVRRAIHAKTIPFVAVGRAYRIPRSFVTGAIGAADAGGNAAVAAAPAPTGAAPAGGAAAEGGAA